FERVFDAMRGQVIRPREIERAAKALGQRRARMGNDNGFSHRTLLPVKKTTARGPDQAVGQSRGEWETGSGKWKWDGSVAPYRPFGRMYTVGRAKKRRWRSWRAFFSFRPFVGSRGANGPFAAAL